MAKNICDHIKEQNLQKGLPTSKLAELSIDEITEVGIYDSLSRQKRKELLSKKTRKVYRNSPITLRLLLKNTLNVTLAMKNIIVLYTLEQDKNDPLNLSQT